MNRVLSPVANRRPAEEGGQARDLSGPEKPAAAAASPRRRRKVGPEDEERRVGPGEGGANDD